MFEQYLLFGTALITGIMLVRMLQREAFEQRSFPPKKPASYVESAPLTWSVFTALVCRDYLRPDAGTFLIIALTIGFFLVIAHMGFLIAMWRTRDGESYVLVPGVAPRMTYALMGGIILFVGAGPYMAFA
jgi:hypothetical protein